MKRALIIIAILVVVAAGGVGAFWYVNQGKARDQILMALEQLDRAGIDTEYEKLSITGFPFAYGGRFEKLKANIPARGLSLELPSATAGMSVGSIGTVDFDLPQSFFVTITEGASAGEKLQVESEALVARVAPGANKVYDLGMTADRVRLTPPGGGADDFIEFWSLVVEGALATGENAGSVDAKFSAASATVAAETPADEAAGLQAGMVKLTADKLDGVVDGDLQELAAKLNAESINVDAGEAGLMSANGVELALKAKPENEFDAEAMFADAASEGALARVVQAAIVGVIDGGAFEGDFSMDTLSASIATELEGVKQAVSIESKNLRYSADLSPALMGFGFAAEALKLDVTGSEELSYDVKDMDLSLKTEAKDAFVLSPLLEASTPDERYALLFDIVRSEIVKGGLAELSFASAGYASESALAIPQVPLERMKSQGGPNHSTIRLTADKASVEARGESLNYEIEGAGMAGAASVGAVELQSAFPMKASAETQQATLLYDIDTITLDDRIWALLDPEGKLSHDIRGMRIAAGLDVVVLDDLLNGATALDAPPIDFQKVDLKEALLDVAGFHAEAAGAATISPPPPAGEVMVTIHDWSGFLQTVSAVPLAQDPQAQTMLLMADAWISQFGVPGDEPTITKLDLKMSEEGGVTVNGKPLEGEPEPAPEQPAEPAQ